MGESMKTIDDIMASYRVRSFKQTGGGLVAIRKDGLWRYFGFDARAGHYRESGSSLRYCH